MLSQVQDFEDGEKLYRLSLSDVDEMTPEIKEMWEKSTITYSRIYKSNHCWRSEPPTCEGLFLKTQDLIYAQKLAEKNGKQNKTTTRSIVQLSPMVFTTLSSILGKRFSNYPIAICGYWLPGFIEDLDLKPPQALTEITEPFAEENL